MRTIFFGASQLGYTVCRTILENRLADVVAIFTIPKKFNISYAPAGVTNYLYADYHQLGAEYSVPVIEVTDKMKNYQSQVESYRPDFLLAIGWYYMIPKQMRDIAPLGCAGIHGSLLPKYRGGAPLVWAMINGEKEAGVSFFYFADGVDDGDIIGQERFPIEQQDTIREVLHKATEGSLSLVRSYLPLIAKGAAPRLAQDHSQATHVPQRKPEDGFIDWSWDRERIRNFIRAQTKPYPGAFTVIDGKKITIWDADITEA